jgi:hypothetical protein
MKIKSFNYFLSTFLTLIIFNCAHANTSNDLASTTSNLEKLNFNISSNRLISFEMIKAKDESRPTFLFLPGVNRGLMSDEVALQSLSELGFGIVTMNFSTQPFSVSQLPSDVSPEFLSKSYSLVELGTEVTALTNELKDKYGIKNIIPVSISFSSAVSSTISSFPLMIDAAPMSSAAAVNPQLENYRMSLKAAEFFNPIYGPGITRSLLDQTYYKTWMLQVDTIVEKFDLNADRKPDMIKGYTVLSRAAEGFIWDIKKTQPTTKRIFILGKKDSSVLLKNQLELVSSALDAGADVLAFVVVDAGHVILSDQPEVYANILNYVATQDTKKVTGIFEITSGEDPKFFTGTEAKKYIQTLIKSL